MTATQTKFKNSWQPPVAEHIPNVNLDTEPEDYDFNFMFEPKVLTGHRVQLRPFVPKLHAQLLYEGTKAHPEVLTYIPSDVCNSVDEACQFVEAGRRNPADLRHAIYAAPLDNQTAAPEDFVFAGTVTLMECSRAHMMGEIGWLVVLQPFHRTYVTTETVGLLMHRILDAPEDGGLGLRRCQWKANSVNAQSAKTAARMGFTKEGVLRALIVLPEGKIGVREGRQGVENAQCMVRDTFMASVTWYEWEAGVREHVDKLMARGLEK